MCLQDQSLQAQKELSMLPSTVVDLLGRVGWHLDPYIMIGAISTLRNPALSESNSSANPLVYV